MWRLIGPHRHLRENNKMYDPAQSIHPRKRVLTPRTQENRPMGQQVGAGYGENRHPAKDDRRSTATVIYRPDQHDPPEILMFATETVPPMAFRANEPVEVPYSRTIPQLLVEKFETAEGIRSRSIERNVPVVEVIRGNPSFEIDGVRPERQRPAQRMPTDADQYRGYAISWISVSMSADSMDKRWIGEEGLRQRCGCSPSDIAYLRPFFDARRVECAELDQQRRNVA
jgi:hypothetical protein